MASSNPHTQPMDISTLLSTSSTPTVTRTKIDFANSPLPQYTDYYAVILDNVLTPSECSALLSAAEASTSAGWERALINTGGGRQALYTDIRNCGRIIWDSREVVAAIWARCAPHLPEIQRLENWPRVTGWGPVRKKEALRMTRLNERMRFLKYTGGEYFKTHCDGTYVTPDGGEASYFTLHLYLNDESSEEEERLIEGGATTFESFSLKQRLDVRPKIGRVLVFQHRDLLHSGDDVVKGVKYTLRTDVMYAKEDVVGSK